MIHTYLSRKASEVHASSEKGYNLYFIPYAQAATVLTYLKRKEAKHSYRFDHAYEYIIIHAPQKG